MLFKTVIKSVISGTLSAPNLEKDQLAKHTNLFKRYLDADLELQLQALYALQDLMVELEHPNSELIIKLIMINNNNVINFLSRITSKYF